MASQLESAVISLGNKCSVGSCGVLLVDGSSSIYPHEFKVIKLAMKSICGKLPLGPKNKLSVVQYSTDVNIEKEPCTKLEDVLNAIDGMQQMRTSTNTHKGFETCLSIISSSNVAYAFVIHLTDGVSSSPDGVRKAANALKGRKYDILNVGIGPNVSRDELFDTSSPSMTYFLPNVDVLNNSFSIETLANEPPPDVELIAKFPTTLELSIIKNNVKEVKVKYFDERKFGGDKEFKNVNPSNPKILLEGLKPYVMYSIWVSVKLNNGVITGESKEVRFRTMWDNPELAFVNDEAKLPSKLDELKKTIGSFSISNYLSSKGISLEDLNYGEDRINIIFMGPGGAGKSTLLNSICAIIEGNWRNWRDAGNSPDSVSTDLYRADCPSNENIALWDIWGWTKKHPYSELLLTALMAGQLDEGFNYDSKDDAVSRKIKQQSSPLPSERMHAVILLYPVTRIDFEEEIKTVSEWHRSLQNKGYSCIVLLTKSDEDDERILINKTMIFQSDIIENLVSQFADKTGIPSSRVIPFVSYKSERDMQQHKSSVIDYIALKAIISAIKQAETYIDNEFVKPFKRGPKGRRSSQVFLPNKSPMKEESEKEEKLRSNVTPTKNRYEETPKSQKDQHSSSPPKVQSNETPGPSLGSQEEIPVIISCDEDILGSIVLSCGLSLDLARKQIIEEVGEFSRFITLMSGSQMPIGTGQEQRKKVSDVVIKIDGNFTLMVKK